MVIEAYSEKGFVGVYQTRINTDYTPIYLKTKLPIQILNQDSILATVYIYNRTNEEMETKLSCGILEGKAKTTVLETRTLTHPQAFQYLDIPLKYFHSPSPTIALKADGTSNVTGNSYTGSVNLQLRWVSHTHIHTHIYIYIYIYIYINRVETPGSKGSIGTAGLISLLEPPSSKSSRFVLKRLVSIENVPDQKYTVIQELNINSSNFLAHHTILNISLYPSPISFLQNVGN